MDIKAREKMNIKLRVILSLLIALIVMVPVIFSQPDKIAGFFIFTAITFVTLFIITSLLNVGNKKVKIIYLTVVVFAFLYKFYMNYFILDWVLQKSIIASLVFAATFALVFRGISLLTEKQKTSMTID